MKNIIDVSFEFFPPKTDKGIENLNNTRQQLAKFNPSYYSVTFGAGGSTQENTIKTVFDICAAKQNVAPHLSCMGMDRHHIKELLHQYIEKGIDRIVALRGDMPSGMGDNLNNDFTYANELVEFIKEETGDHFLIEVAAYPEIHPQAIDAKTDLLNFKRKVDAGADGAITQYFYSLDAYFYFLDQCEQLEINIPIIPGIMPITNANQILRFSDACGAEIPRWIRKRLVMYQDDPESIYSFGLDVVMTLCENLMNNGVPGLHFYTMNKAEPIVSICKHLGFCEE